MKKGNEIIVNCDDLTALTTYGKNHNIKERGIVETTRVDVFGMNWIILTNGNEYLEKHCSLVNTSPQAV